MFILLPLGGTRRSALSFLNIKHYQKVFKHTASTVDQSEVDKHSNKSHVWWDVKGPMKALHSLNELRVPFVRDGILGKNTPPSPKPLLGKKILDVACGGGILTEPLARLGAQITGVDASPDLIEIAQEHSQLDLSLSNNRPTYICTRVEDHAKDNLEVYDAIVASEIIEHVTEKELFVSSLVQSLKPGGSIFFTTPTRTRLAWFFGIIVAEYVMRVLPRGTHEYDKFTTPPELMKMLEKLDCKTLAVHGAFYNTLSNRWTWSDSQDFLFLLHAIKASPTS